MCVCVIFTHTHTHTHTYIYIYIYIYNTYVMFVCLRTCVLLDSASCWSDCWLVLLYRAVTEVNTVRWFCAAPGLAYTRRSRDTLTALNQWTRLDLSAGMLLISAFSFLTEHSDLIQRYKMPIDNGAGVKVVLITKIEEQYQTVKRGQWPWLRVRIIAYLIVHFNLI